MREITTERTTLSPRIRRMIDGLRADKQAINQEKIGLFMGKMNFDDWGFVHAPDFTFEPPPSEREDGLIRGYVAIGNTLRKFLNEMPAYVNKHSALAGAWPQAISEYARVGVAPEDVPAQLVPVWEKYHTYPGFCGMNHCAGDMALGLSLGWGGLLDKLRYHRALNDPVDPAFYDGEEALVLGTREHVARLVETAEAMAAAEPDPFLAANLDEIARVNRKLVTEPPETLREACQFIAHFQIIDRVYFVGGALGQIDQFLLPFYERDIAAGRITDEDAVWYIASIFFNDTHYSQVAGLSPDGLRDTTNRLSFLVLDAIHALGIPANIAVRVSDKVHPSLLRRAVEYILEDGTGASFSLNEGCENGYAKNGYPIELARQRIKVGCNWTAVPGREYPLQDVTRANLAMALYFALQDLRSEAAPSLEILWQHFERHTRVIVNSIKAGYDHHYEVVSRNTPEMVYNLFMHGPVERGLNCAQGGVDILNLNIDGIGLATVADSFAAIEQRVVTEKRLDWAELFHLLDTNYDGREEDRLMLKNIRRFGCPDSPAEKWALRVRDTFVACCRDGGTPKHNLPVIPGMFSHGNILEYAEKLPATPNGRKAFEALSHSNEPDPGFARGLDSFSPTLKATAVAKTQPGFGNSSPLHLDIDADMLEKEGGVEALVGLIHVHNHMGGTLINLNCLNREKLEAAHRDPTAYPDLVVRVTGYSAFFASLTKEYRQQIVDRFLSKENVR